MARARAAVYQPWRGQFFWILAALLACGCGPDQEAVQGSSQGDPKRPWRSAHFQEQQWFKVLPKTTLWLSNQVTVRRWGHLVEVEGQLKCRPASGLPAPVPVPATGTLTELEVQLADRGAVRARLAAGGNSDLSYQAGSNARFLTCKSQWPQVTGVRWKMFFGKNQVVQVPLGPARTTLVTWQTDQSGVVPASGKVALRADSLPELMDWSGGSAAPAVLGAGNWVSFAAGDSLALPPVQEPPRLLIAVQADSCSPAEKLQRIQAVRKFVAYPPLTQKVTRMETSGTGRHRRQREVQVEVPIEPFRCEIVPFSSRLESYQPGSQLNYTFGLRALEDHAFAGKLNLPQVLRDIASHRQYERILLVITQKGALQLRPGEILPTHPSIRRLDVLRVGEWEPTVDLRAWVEEGLMQPGVFFPGQRLRQWQEFATSDRYNPVRVEVDGALEVVPSRLARNPAEIAYARFSRPPGQFRWKLNGLSQGPASPSPVPAEVMERAAALACIEEWEHAWDGADAAEKARLQKKILALSQRQGVPCRWSSWRLAQ